jgi:hypothetical protein
VAASYNGTKKQQPGKAKTETTEKLPEGKVGK